MLSPTPEPPPTRRMPTWAAMLLGGMLLSLGIGLAALVVPLWTSPPIDAASTSRSPSAPISSGPAFDPTASAALAQIAEAFSTSVAPTVTPLPTAPATATYAVATEIPHVLCGTWVPLGSVCEQPLPPKPSPTAIPDCPVAPRDLCRWRGSLGTPAPAVNVGAPWRPS